MAGKGEFSFIDQPERIPALVAHSLQGLTSSVSLNMVLKIEGNNVSTSDWQHLRCRL